jgi:hypothetical protein
MDSDSRELVHPATGELLDSLDQQPAEILAEWTLQADELQARLKTFREDLDVELRRRLELIDRAAHVYGDYEVSLKRSPREAVWDGDELEAELRRLVDDGTLRARELTGVITHETVVHRSEANKILGQLSGPAKAAIERCRIWRNKGRAKIEVVRSVSLIPDSGAEQDTSTPETAGSVSPPGQAGPAPQPQELEW